MSSEACRPGALVRCLLAGLAAGLASCGAPSQKMDLSQDMIDTPPHRMSRTEYPFDAGGRYVDAWAAEGAPRYGRFVNTDLTEDGRNDEGEPSRRPPRAAAATPPATDRPPSTSRSGAGSSGKPPSKKSAANPAKPGSKPPAKKPPVKKKTTTHTVKRGDSLGSLSRRYGVSVQAIKKANNLKSDRIIDGRRLVIPKK